MLEDTNDVQNAQEEMVETPTTPEVETTTEEVEDDSGVSLTTDDYYREKKAREDAERKLAELQAQKEHWKKKAEKKPLVETQTTDFISRDEAILIAKGYDEDIIEQASLISKAKGIGIKDALKDPILEAYIEKKEKQTRREKAQLGTSSGSDNAEPIFKPGQSRDEHKKMWAKEIEKY